MGSFSLHILSNTTAEATYTELGFTKRWSLEPKREKKETNMNQDLSKPTVPGVYRCTRIYDNELKQTVYRRWDGNNFLYDPDDSSRVDTPHAHPITFYEGPFVLLQEVKPPVVIEGEGQRAEPGLYWRRYKAADKSGYTHVELYKGEIHAEGYQYIKIEEPTFPPLPPPVPPKPELKLYRYKKDLVNPTRKKGDMFWGYLTENFNMVYSTGEFNLGYHMFNEEIEEVKNGDINS